MSHINSMNTSVLMQEDEDSIEAGVTAIDSLQTFQLDDKAAATLQDLGFSDDMIINGPTTAPTDNTNSIEHEENALRIDQDAGSSAIIQQISLEDLQGIQLTDVENLDMLGDGVYFEYTSDNALLSVPTTSNAGTHEDISDAILPVPKKRKLASPAKPLPVSVSTSSSGPINAVIVYPCDKCKKAFKTKTELKQHEETHDDTEQTIFTCKLCSAKFINNDELQTHMKLSHQDNRIISVYNCDACSYQNCNRAAVMQHAANAHRGVITSVSVKVTTVKTEPPAMKPEPQRVQIEPVVKIKTPVENNTAKTKSLLKTFTCAICNVMCNIADLKAHMETHATGSVLMHHICKSCNEDFKSATELNKHQSKQFCSRCNESFQATCKLKSHITKCQSEKAALQREIRATTQCDVAMSTHCDIKSTQSSIETSSQRDFNMPVQHNVKALAQHDVRMSMQRDVELSMTRDIEISSQHDITVSIESDFKTSMQQNFKPLAQRDMKISTQRVTTINEKGTNSIDTDDTLKLDDAGEEVIYQCGLCTFEADNQQAVQLHLLHKHQVDEVDIQQDEVTDHNSAAEELAVCEVCGIVLDSSAALREHVITHQDKLLHECKECGEMFVSKKALVIHSKIHTTENKQTDNDNNTGVIKCMLCGYASTKTSDIVQHVKLHQKIARKNAASRDSCRDNLVTQPVATVKEMCQIYQVTQAEVTRLIDESKDGTCVKCGKEYTDLNSLEEHIKGHMEHRFECIICHMFFPTFAELKTHCVSHTGGNSYSCQICSRSFKRYSDVTTHLQVHEQHSSHFSCGQCDALFTDKVELTEHIKEHYMTEVFRCEQCPKRFKKLGLLQQHMMSHSSHRPFSCPICRVRFKVASSVFSHINKKHKKLASFWCPDCKQSFTDIDSFKMHIRLHMRNRTKVEKVVE